MFDYITFLTDFGLQDDFVGVCRGVMKRIARDAQIIDVTHGIAPQAVAQGALVLARSVPYLPPAVHLAVVDPGVGSERRAVAISTASGRIFVGPDNGLLAIAARPPRGSRGCAASRTPTTTSSTSRGPSTRGTCSRPSPRTSPPARASRARRRGRPGDARPRGAPRRGASTAPSSAPPCSTSTASATSASMSRPRRSRRSASPVVRPSSSRSRSRPYFAVVGATYADAARGELILYEDSYGGWAIAINGGNAAALTEAGPGDEVRIRAI